MSHSLNGSQLREFAVVGARQEVLRIFELFPELRREFTTVHVGKQIHVATGERTRVGTVTAIAPAASPARTRVMSAAARRLISKRMKAYWAKRRGEKTDATPHRR